MLNCGDCIRVAARSIKVQDTAALFTSSTSTVKNQLANINRNATLLVRVPASEHHGHTSSNYICNVWILICAIATVFSNVTDNFR